MRLTIITPSFNQGQFIKATINSVLDQRYPDLEYLIMDGGSTDNTIETVLSYEDQLVLESERDGGQAAAVNKGILKATGDIIGWLNSDDIYYPGSFQAVMKVFEDHPEIQVLYGDADHIDEGGAFLDVYPTEEWNYRRLIDECYLCQPAVFFRREAALRAGLLNPRRQFSMDYDFWLRLGRRTDFFYLRQKLAGSRMYAENKTLGSVEKVHLDNMNMFMEILGYVPEKWVIGSAQVTNVARGYKGETKRDSMIYQRALVRRLYSFCEAYGVNQGKKLSEYPYKYNGIVIGIDSSVTAVPHAAGVGFYTSQVIRAIAEKNDYNRFYLYNWFNYRVVLPDEKMGLEIRQPNFQTLFADNKLSMDDVNYAFLEPSGPEYMMNLLRWPDVVLYPAFLFSRKLAKETAAVYTIHDLALLEHPEYSTPENYQYCWKNLYEAALYSDLFLAVSEYTKKIFLKYFPFIDPKRVIVAYHGYKEIVTKKLDKVSLLRELGIQEGEKFWLCVGTVEPRKNLVGLVRAYDQLCQRLTDETGSGACVSKRNSDKKTKNIVEKEIKIERERKRETAKETAKSQSRMDDEARRIYPLYIAGGKGWKDSEIYQAYEQSDFKDQIHFLNYVSDEQLAALYQSCYAMVYPSYYEGFGMPILEAMAAGAPVISSDTTSMPEVGGDAVLYVQPEDIRSIAKAMEKLQIDQGLRDDLAQRGKKRALSVFGWDRCAEITLRTMYDAVRYRAEMEGLD